MHDERLENSADLERLVSKPTSDAGLSRFYTRPDFALFHQIETLTAKVGVSVRLLRRVVVKELVDNGLDLGADVTIHSPDPDTVIVHDDGPGIPGGPEMVARLFSTGRELVSSKLLRLPTRGALGNGLRAVAGAVYAARGTLVVTTGGQRVTVVPWADGTSSTTVEPVGPTIGTTVAVRFGAALPRDSQMLSWGELAIAFSHGGGYTGRSSPHWYDADAWHALLQASPPDDTVREFLSILEGCTGKARHLAQPYKGRTCRSLSRQEATALLVEAHQAVRPVPAKRLGYVGEQAGGHWMDGYAKSCWVHTVGGHAPYAKVPFLIEAWAGLSDEPHETNVEILINRTPVVAEVEAQRRAGHLDIFGCGLRHAFDVPGKRGIFVRINVITPYMPITSDGKAPDLSRYRDPLEQTISKAVRQAARLIRDVTRDEGSSRTQKDIVLERLDKAIAHASGDGEFRFTIRQLYYVMRPMVKEAIGRDLQYANFNQIVAGFENEIGHDLPGIIRDPRGNFLHPHDGSSTPLGTVEIENYRRPPWLFNKVLFIEKEGFNTILADNRWAERHDCAVISCKGFSTAAAKDLIDLLGESGEPVRVFAIHDADAPGSLIYETLVGETKRRGARTVDIINLGLEPWEAVEELGLEVEDIGKSEERRPVADYIRERSLDGGTDWDEWLQTRRVELNAFTTPAFLSWLDRKMAPYGGKLVPPGKVIRSELEGALTDKVRTRIMQRILDEAGFEDRVADAVAAIKFPSAEFLAADVRSFLKKHRDRPWRERVMALADELAGGTE